ncbi:16S rRNA (cytidine(1402)-2'-O)-methyltransferase [Candidatus Saganbacteria bacterium]|nr:16S rRNA (cytidine(1402)-2'-O)-methyltransferase [Candidatus Saganbacteria bacterium]
MFVVATPIGNLEDITYRAVRVLSEVDLIAAEDTRQTKILLNRYNITTPMTSYHKFNIRSKTDYLISLLRQGKNLALVTDSGTPGISDPGQEIIKSAIESNIKVDVIPGPCAAISALVGSGLPTENFLFVGFLPKKPGKKRKALEALREQLATIIIYESPFRVWKTLVDIQTIMGERSVAVCRELTKKFEEIIRGKVGEVITQLQKRTIKGEIVLVVSGFSQETSRGSK